MTVYLDDSRILWRGKRWSHLYADSLPELERFARQVGLPSWLQNPDGAKGLPHYDVTGIVRAKCEQLGASPVTGGDGNYVRLRQSLARGEYDLGERKEQR